MRGRMATGESPIQSNRSEEIRNLRKSIMEILTGREDGPVRFEGNERTIKLSAMVIGGLTCKIRAQDTGGINVIYGAEELLFSNLKEFKNWIRDFGGIFIT